MRNLLIFFIFVTNLFSLDEGAVLYSSCKFCHGNKAEKIYMDAIPSLRDSNINTLIKKLEGYKAGTINDYGFGEIMKQQMKNIPDEKITTLAKYIKNL